LRLIQAIFAIRSAQSSGLGRLFNRFSSQILRPQADWLALLI
jgi:hypothetical protein